MGKNKNKPVKPFKIDMVINLDGLDGIPPETEAPQIFMNWAIKSILLFSQQSKGLMIQHHRQLKGIRDRLEEETKTYGESRKKKVLEAIREELHLEGMELYQVKEMLELLIKAPQNTLYADAQAKMQEIAEAEVHDAHAFVEFEPEDWKFLNQCWRESRKPGEANEVIMRIDDALKDAQSNHDREANEPEPKEETEEQSSSEEKSEEEKPEVDAKAETPEATGDAESPSVQT